MLERFHRYLFSTKFVAGIDVLDISCGDGYGSNLLGRDAKTVIGIDVDAAAVAHAAKIYSSANIEFRRGSAEHIPLETESVDVVVSFETTEHHHRHEKMLAEIKRVLRPNGLLIMSSPHKELHSDACNHHNQDDVKILHKQEFTDLVSRHFAHLSLFSQKITYGSGIFPEGASFGFLNFSENERRSRPGFPAPLYSLAFASDDPARAAEIPGSFMELDRYKSEAMSEYFGIEGSLRQTLSQKETHAAALQEVLSQKEQETAALQAALRHREDYAAALRAALSYSAEATSRAFKTLARQEAEREARLEAQREQEALQEAQNEEQRKERQEALRAAQQEEQRNALREARQLDEISRQAQRFDMLWRFTLLWRVMFHKSGKPRGWMRPLLRAERSDGKPSVVARRLLFKKNGQVRPVFSAWYREYAAESQLAEAPAPFIELSLANIVEPPTKASTSASMAMPDYRNRLRSVQQTGSLSMARNILIVTTAHTTFVGEAIKAALAGARLDCATTTVMPEIFESDLYIVVCPQMFPQLPPADKLICFQMEQTRSSSWFSDEYLNILLNSLAILDYSIDNIEYLQARGASLYQTYYVPIQPKLSLRSDANGVRDIDVLFYGAINSPRRHRFFEALRRKFNIRIETELFGEPLRALLLRAKVVVNIHFYEDALLETTRIAEALSHGARVVSETARDQARHDALKGLVEFAEVNDIDGFVDLVERTLLEESPPVADALADLNNSPWGMRSLMARALHGVGVLDYEEFEAATDEVRLGKDCAVLCLPESTHRFANAENGAGQRAVLFPGLRNIDGWKGAALSYKYLAARALREGMTPFTIWEDDAELPREFNQRYEAILAYLDQLGGGWDIFSGLLSDLAESAKIDGVDQFQDDVFVKINSVIGMVFGIYNRSSLELLARFSINGDDTMKHTIDRYLESKHLSCVTSITPLVEHSVEYSSTLWSSNGISFVTNTKICSMINDSQKRLVRKVIEYYDNHEDASIVAPGVDAVNLAL